MMNYGFDVDEPSLWIQAFVLGWNVSFMCVCVCVCVGWDGVCSGKSAGLLGAMWAYVKVENM